MKIDEKIEKIRTKWQARFDASWEEEKHPRTKNGQFTKKGTGESSGGADVKKTKSATKKGSTAAHGKKLKKSEASSEENSESKKKSSSKTPLSRSSEYKVTYTAETPGEVISGKNGDFKPKSDAARTIDLKDGLEELGKGKRNSLEGNLDENGKLTPERQKIHDDILHKFFKDKVKFDGTPTMTMSGGGPASGKSFVTKNAEKKFGKETVVKVDPDEIKSMFPGYEAQAEKFYDAYKRGEEDNEISAAAYFHEESSALAKRIYQYAVENGVNAVYDGTGDGSVKSVKAKIDAARAEGYNVTGEYVTVDTDEAVNRNKSRFIHGAEKFEKAKSNGGVDDNGVKVEPPRLVLESVVRETHKKVTDISIEVAGLFDSFTLTDNNGDFGTKKDVIATCKRGEGIKVVPGMEKKFTGYLNKGEKKYKIEKNGGVSVAT